eukprot:Plantae.Rhodophyta-Purpureofilum_apyrenoidigerum.ctg7076.p1 GENE.Plantae.Rhodophyta-Purpureofilum_apyrenoidigerum.ctg7076~~Plantae.Rhodophyta-Purpureofilum_apyrenoidigerum.ctg7076.p1  ORF type:complete len:239 (-),score=35.57 Plantae.Rhodophyta-Purpureofilum_apyrenoidigerum.ctg7076:151-813(-)
MVTAGDFGWIEIFHSLPSWKRCFVVFKKDEREWVPNATYELVDAAHIRDGFRVFRVQAKKLEFYLTNGSKLGRDDNTGKNYHIGMPGRYVCGQGVFFRVSDADETECERFLYHSDIEIVFRPPKDMKKVYAMYKDSNSEWTPAPGKEMSTDRDGSFSVVIPTRTTEVAFTDGKDFWDSNMSRNYIIGAPGKYVVNNGYIKVMENEPEHNFSDRSSQLVTA